VKGQAAPPSNEALEECRPYFDAGEELPLNLLAKLIKSKLLEIKQEDVKRRSGEKVWCWPFSSCLSWLRLSEKTFILVAFLLL